MYEELHEKEFYFEPRSENLEDIVKNTMPREKNVFAIASYGYGLVFLARGAASVDSIDVDSKKIAWNFFLKAMIESCEYEEALQIMRNQRNETRTIIEQVPERYKKTAEEIRKLYADKNPGKKARHTPAPEGAKLLEVYPFLESNETYKRVKEADHNRKWNINEEELVQFLEKNARTYDVIYISTIRSWVLNCLYHSVTQFENKCDLRLRDAVEKRLNSQGLFYEAVPIPWEIGASVANPISERVYPFLTIKREMPIDDLSEMTIYVGRKR